MTEFEKETMETLKILSAPFLFTPWVPMVITPIFPQPEQLEFDFAI